MCVFRFIRLLSFILIISSLAYLSAQEAAGDELANDTTAAERLVMRVTPEFAGRVHFSCVQGQPQPSIHPLPAHTPQPGIRISANSVAECIRAYGWYLRHVAHVHLSWNGDNRSAARFVVPEHELTVPPTLPLNFAYNYCTYSYTGAHWDEDRWMQELDRLALNGFRYVLITPGLEKVWQKFLTDIGYPADKIARFIAAPTYSAWWLMGNLEGEGGPVSQELIEREAHLGRQLVSRARELGLVPALQGYVGFVPHDYRPNDPDIIDQGKWLGYNRPAVLSPDSERFERLAHLWYKRLTEVYGIHPRAFVGDLFHEGGRTTGVTLDKAAAAVQSAMQRCTPGSLWFIQAWGGNPRPELLAGTSPQYTVILALHKDLSPHSNISRHYDGRRYVWCELANFGGKHGLYGGFDILENMTGHAGGASGFGLLSEGLETNPLYYELFYERINNRSRIDRQAFLARYALARYNSRDARVLQALNLLASTVYTPNQQREGGQENIICARPNLRATRASTWSDPSAYYNPADLVKAGRLLLQAAQDSPELRQLSTFRYDLADICRQVLADRARVQLQLCRAAFDAGDTARQELACRDFLKLIEQSAAVTATHPDFLLGNYLRGVARRAGESQAALQQRNLRRLITTWRPEPSSLNDYAHRQYSELLRYYYLPRWQAYFNSLREGKAQGTLHARTNTNNGSKVTMTWEENEAIDAVEQAFPTADIPLLTEPRGDLMRLAEDVLH